MGAGREAGSRQAEGGLDSAADCGARRVDDTLAAADDVDDDAIALHLDIPEVISRAPCGARHCACLVLGLPPHVRAVRQAAQLEQGLEVRNTYRGKAVLHKNLVARVSQTRSCSPDRQRPPP